MFRIHRRHAHAAARLADGQALGANVMKRLARRHVARAEFSCDVILPQRCAGRQLSGNNAFYQRFGDALSNCRRSFRNFYHHRLSIRFPGASSLIAW
jgi:hypothetical protein